jgi:UDP-N-acetylglucosamine--N-acetylmuramyl-(pentapeptide) pyrophosphoryl-undecaprenol N-acetylglucosamine transferase
MEDLLAAADLVVGRSGAVSVAEYAAAGVASICIPYPHHRDRQQHLNAGQLARAGASVVVDEAPGDAARTEALWRRLEPLMIDGTRRRRMAQACGKLARLDAADVIARCLLRM